MTRLRSDHHPVAPDGTTESTVRLAFAVSTALYLWYSRRPITIRAILYVKEM